jgi:hypothetical protein
MPPDRFNSEKQWVVDQINTQFGYVPSDDDEEDDENEDDGAMHQDEDVEAR